MHFPSSRPLVKGLDATSPRHPQTQTLNTVDILCSYGSRRGTELAVTEKALGPDLDIPFATGRRAVPRAITCIPFHHHQIAASHGKHQHQSPVQPMLMVLFLHLAAREKPCL
ncbi:hypothetical protein TWF281_007439 [Arthrobotrys megalospora]